MSLAIATSIKSTTVRSDAGVPALLRAYFRLASHLMPRIARRHAARLFTSPPRYAGRAPQRDARQETVRSGEHLLAVWQVGPQQAPAVLLAHGWGGRGAQLDAFVPPLLAAGYRVVWFDQPGHGASARGDRRDAVAMPDFTRALHTLSATHGPFRAVIAHSFGAAALGVALRAGLDTGRVVLVSSPASMREHARRFARLLGITPEIRESMRQLLERRHGLSFADVDRIDELARVRVPSLLVHDVHDDEIPFEHTQRLAALLPGARVIRTWGFGHHRILREPSVVRAIVDFVRGDVDRLPTQLPRLPRPAPLY
jgi:pimeloyl-ACP methyl ester carboxylesterase